MKIRKILKKIFGFENPEKIRLWDPERLGSKIRTSYARNYKKLKRTFLRGEIAPYVKGRKVKCWKMVKSADESFQDEFIPIYYKKK